VSAVEPVGPVHTGARCDWPLGCDVDVQADYLAHNWAEAAGYHARDLKAAGWVIDRGDYYCPVHAAELR
jgi:hypothetical protein